MKLLFTALLFATALQQPPDTRTFTGTVTDSECGDANHSRMRMGDTDAECVAACIDAHAAAYVLFDGQATYALSDQKGPARFAGRKVRVTGTLDSRTKRITVVSIEPAQ